MLRLAKMSRGVDLNSSGILTWYTICIIACITLEVIAHPTCTILHISQAIGTDDIFGAVVRVWQVSYVTIMALTVGDGIKSCKKARTQDDNMQQWRGRERNSIKKGTRGRRKRLGGQGNFSKSMVLCVFKNNKSLNSDRK